MAQNVTLSELRTQIADQLDVTVGANTRYTPTFFNQKINSSIRRFRERVSSEGMTHFLVATSGTMTSGATSPFSFKELDLSAVTPSVVRTYGVDITVSNIVRTLAHRPFQERNERGGPTVTGIPEAWAMYQTRSIAIMPAPDQSYFYTVWYLPLATALSADGDTFDAVDGWEQWIVWDVVCQLIARDQYQAAYAQAVQLRNEVWQDVIRGATKVTSAGGAVVGRDTLRGSRFMRRGDCGPVAGSGLPPDGSVTNAMLVNMAEGTTKGRALGAGAGVPTDMTPGLTARNVAVYSGLAAGLVPTGNNGTSLFLREDATWAAPSVGGSVSGLALSQLQNIAPDRVLGRATVGTGAVEQLLGQQVASMIAVFTGAAHGLVPRPTGGLGAGLFLRDDATWAAAAGGVSSGIANNQLNPFPPLTVLGNPNVASGTADYLTRGQVASMMPLFGVASGSTRGFVYSPTAGVAGRFLRDDGSFQGVPSNAPTGLGVAAIGPADPLSVLGNFESATGAPGWVGRGNVASLLPLFGSASGSTRGFVYAPTAGVANRFLRDDGSFQGIPSLTPTGIGLTQLGAIPETTILGRTSPSGIPEALVPSVVATMMPLFNAVDKGLVPGSGGGTTNFLRADGTFAAPPGGGGGGSNNPGGPTGSFQFNQGSGIFAGASGFNFTASGIDLQYNLNMPTGAIRMGATGGVPEVAIGSVGGRLSVGFGLTPSGGDLLFGRSASSNNVQILARDSDGYGALREAVAIDRTNAPSGALDLYFGNPTNTRSANLRGHAATINAANPTGTIRGQLGSNNVEAFAARPGHHSWGVSGAQKLGLDNDGLNVWGQLGMQRLAHSATTDKLGSWTASGFANIATGILVGASGYQLGIGSGGPILHASGIDMRSGVIENAKRIGGLDGIKLYGFIGGGGAASGGQDIVSASGTAFVVPATTTTGQIYALVPTLAIHGDTVLIDNRSGSTHRVNNAGTGMGVPSGFIATLAPSMGISCRFASGAWEFGNRYQLGGY